jgi:hypothetical protein
VVSTGVARAAGHAFKSLPGRDTLPGDIYMINSIIFRWDWNHKGKTWSWYIRQILEETNQGEFIDDVFSGRVDFSQLLYKASEELMNIEIERWNTELSNQPKLRFYRLFKSEYLTEPYILKCHNKSTRSFIAQIRAGVLPLQVEVGRFIQQALQDRICQHCKSVEDELHFIFDCPLYLQLRIEFYNQVSKFYRICDFNNSEKLHLFMSDPCILNKFGSYIRNCFYKRNTYLYHSVS